MRAIGTDHETARCVELGMECSECAEPFVRAHGCVTACSHCWPKLSLEERKVVLRAEHEEATALHFKTQARKRRAQQENQNNG